MTQRERNIKGGSDRKERYEREESNKEQSREQSRKEKTIKEKEQRRIAERRSKETDGARERPEHQQTERASERAWKQTE